MPPTSEATEIPERDLRQYRVFRDIVARASTTPQERAVAQARIDKLEAKYPALREAYNRRQEHERLYERVREGMPGVPRPEEVMAPNSDSWADTLRRLGHRILGKDPLQWAAERIEQSVRDYVTYVAENGIDLDFDTWDEAYMTLDKQIRAQVGVDIEEFEEDETGVPFYSFTIEIPVDLFEKIEAQGGGAKLWAFLVDCLTNDDEGEDD